MKIIGYRKRNGRIEANFIKCEIDTKKLEDERKKMKIQTGADGIDFAYKQKLSKSDYQKLHKELYE